MNVRRPGPPIIPSLAAYIKLPRINGNAECIAPITSSNSRSNISSLARADGNSAAFLRQLVRENLGPRVLETVVHRPRKKTVETVNRDSCAYPGARCQAELSNFK